MKLLNKSLWLLLILITVSSCFEDRDDNAILSSEINDFVWKGMNIVYLYKDEIPNLADDRFSSNQDYGNYLNGFDTPESLFESLIFDRQVTDRFSIIVDDYIALEQLFAGTSKTNGLRYYSFNDPRSSNRMLVIRQVLPNSVAANANLVRGQYIYQIDGTPLTSDNINTLLGQDTFTLHFADYNNNGTPETSDDFFTPNGQTVSLTKAVLTENPIHKTAIIDVDGKKVGYILYNGFNQNFDNELNAAFSNFKSNNIEHLVIDLRYNPGGSVNTARLLGSMVTGQFNGQVFSKLIYNSTLQSENTNFEFVNSFGGNTINSLNLSKVYVLTTSSSASASELLINSLKPYITVVQIGRPTVGKTQASITIYDSPTFGREEVNPNHTYAMQPLVANSINVNDQAVPGTGLTPDIDLLEDVYNLGSFGNVTEPLLARAIAHIRGSGRFALSNQNMVSFDIPKAEPVFNEMYIDQEFRPQLIKRLFFN
jgi:C-terminal processing protease CtpA/Prc